MKPVEALWSYRRWLVLGLAAVVLVAAAGAAALLRGTAPTVAAFAPSSAQPVAANAGISITFDAPMDRASVERALTVEPATELTYGWDGDTVEVRPATGGWARGTSYTVRLDRGARSVFFAPLDKPHSFSFLTATPLAVHATYPSSSASEVEVESAIAVQFTNPVVPLALRESTFAPLRLEPPVDGKGTWVTSSTYLFRPASPLRAATRYVATVPKGVADTTGDGLTADVTWAFTTRSPAVESVEPADNARFVDPVGSVKVGFSQPMDRASTEAAFRLATADGQAVSGQFTWETARQLVFRPAVALRDATAYRLSVSAEAKGEGGAAGLVSAFGVGFTTIGQPAVVTTSPQPGGRPDGQVAIAFSYPMDRDATEAAIAVDPKPDQVHFNWVESDARAVIWWARRPAIRYTVSVGAGARGRYGHPIAAPFAFSFVAPDLPPFVQPVGVGFLGTYSADTTPEIYLRHRNIAAVDLALYRVSEDEFLQLVREPYRAERQFTPTDQALVRGWQLTDLAGTPNETAQVKTSLAGSGSGKLPPGRYFLRATAQAPSAFTVAGSLTGYQILTVSKTTIVLKRTETQLLAWAVDLATGQPRAGLELAADWFSLSPTGGRGSLGRGRADAKGLLYLEHQPLGPDKQVFVRGPDGDDFTAVLSTWSNGIDPWAYGLNAQFVTQPLRGYLYTERPIYRPGQKVYFRGILRLDDDGAYSPPPPGTSLHVNANDPQGKLAFSGDFQTDAGGSVDGEIPLADGAPSGNYVLAARVGPVPGGLPPTSSSGPPYTFGTQFGVAAYRKPEFAVKVSLDRPGYVHGDRVRGTVKAEYYFGAPVAGAKVEWRATARDYWFRRSGERYEFVDWPERSWWQPLPQRQTGLRAQGQGTTGPDGTLQFEFGADVAKDDLSQLFTIEASVLDVNNQSVSERTEVTVHKASFYVGLRVADYVARPGEPKRIELFTVDAGAGGQSPAPVTRPQTPVRLSLFFRRWFSVKQKQPDGWYYWESKHEDRLISERDLTTDADGKATVDLVPDRPGTFRVVAEGRDERGNPVRSATYFYATGPDYVPWRLESNDRIQLIPDKPEYQVGETARVMVPSPYADALALITLERGKILRREVRILKGNSEVLDIPITAEHVPNAYVSVALVKAQPDGKLVAFRLGYAELKVNVAEKTLRVAVSTDRARYQPGDTVTYRITTTDRSGRGVPAQLSLALVDAAVLALGDDSAGDLVKGFYGSRGLGVQTASGLVVSIDRLNAEIAKGSKGAGDGLAGPLAVRTEFPDTAYWSAKVETDANGRAVVPVKLPDNLTTWRLRVRGVTVETLVGSADHDLAVAKPLLIRPVAPRFFVAGDEARLEAIVHNDTDREVEARATLSATGLLAAPAAGPPSSAVGGGVRGEDFPSQTVRVPAGGREKVGWTVRAGPAGEATLTFTVEPTQGEPPGDALRLVLPIHEVTALQTVAASSGEVRTAVTEAFRLPDDADRVLGEVTLETTPSLAAGLRYSLHYLEEWPYEHTESTISRFLPRLAMNRAFNRLGLAGGDGLRTALPDLVIRSVQRLQLEQRADGGWGWWSNAESNPTITAYALLGLAEARRAGHAVDDTVLRRAAGYLRQDLDRPLDERDGERLNARAFALDAMAEAGYGDLGLLRSLYERRGALGQYGRAFLALGLMAQDRDATRAEVAALASEFVTAARWTASSAHWEESRAEARQMNTNTRSTALVLRALIKADPESPVVPAAVRWLMVARKEGHWETTQETAWSILALTDYLGASGELDADYGYAVQLNDDLVASARVTHEQLDQVTALRLDVARLRGENRLRIARLAPEAGQTGQGRLYYTLRARYEATAGAMLAEDRGIALLREYLRPGAEEQGPIAEVGAGDVVKVRLTVLVPGDVHYFVLEDRLPAGLEAVDTRLKTSSLAAQEQTGLKEKKPGQDPDATPFAAKPWRPYFERSEVRDDRVAVFATFLPRGTYEYTYLARATTGGRFQALPAEAREMYAPEVWGRSAGATFVVR